MQGRTFLRAVISIVIVGVSSIAGAQSTFQAPRGESVPFVLESSPLANHSKQVQVLFSEVVQFPNAAWLRVFFSTLNLEGQSTLRITSLLDGEVQVLNAEAATMWSNSTAYFNGDSVLIELLGAPGTTRNQLTLDHVDVEFIGSSEETFGSNGQCGVCGTDDRQPSNQNWSGRLMPTGCTASVFDQCGCLVSAGHCATGGMVVQFNVPNSQPNCAMVNPPVADQFPIIAYQYAYVDIGNDWSVLKAGTNGLGQKPYDRYGLMKPIATTTTAPGQLVEIWSFGLDNNCVNSQRQQYSSGQVNVVSPTWIQFSADLRTGASGTGVIRNGTIVGVATNCMVYCPNVATAVTQPTFAAARASMCQCGTVQACPADLNTDHLVNIDDLVTVLTHWGSCPSSPLTCLGDVVHLPPLGTVGIDDLVQVLTSWGTCP